MRLDFFIEFRVEMYYSLCFFFRKSPIIASFAFFFNSHLPESFLTPSPNILCSVFQLFMSLRIHLEESRFGLQRHEVSCE